LLNKIINVILPSVVNLFVTFTKSDGSGNNQGVGTGIIYSQDGYIVTNNHVAGGTSQIVVTMNDGSNIKAKRREE
jgi:S1-C subfamily serine protease